MSEGEYRLVRITIQLKKLQLGVKFPCSISFQLKHENNAMESRQNYQLRSGQCFPNDKLTLELEVLYEGERYADKSAHLIVFMTSANGKIPAGSTFVSVTDLGMLPERGEESMGLTKCPDKNAKIVFNKRVEFIRSVRRAQTETRNQKVRTLLLKSRNLRTNTSGNKKQISARYLKSGEKEETPKYMNTRQHIKDKWNSAIRSPYVIESNDSLDKSQGSQEIESRLIYKLEEENFGDEKLYALEKEKLQYVKEISRLKGELNLIKRNQYHDNEEKVAKYCSEVDRLSDELEKAKDRFRNLEKKEKESAVNNRDLRDELEKTKNKLGQYELMNMENQLLLEERLKLIKTLTQDLKGTKEELEDLKINKTAQDKKYEFKEQSFREQFDKLNEKYQQSETQRQKSLYELNNKLAQLGEIEKKNQLNLKEKERHFLDEKSILSKKIEALNKQIENLTEQKQDSMAKNKQLEGNLANLHKKYEQKADELSKTKSEKEVLEIEIKKYENTVERNDKEIEQLRTIMEERNKLKKSYNDRSVENERHKQLYERHAKTVKQLEKKLKETQQISTEITKEKNILNNKLLMLTKDFENMKKANESKDRQIDTLNTIVENTTIKMNELKIKSENDFMRSEEMKRQLEEELTFLLKKKQHLQGEYEETKWRLSKSKESTETLHEKLNQNNEEILHFNQELLTLQEKNKKLAEEIKEHENIIQFLKSQKQALEQKDKEMSEVLKSKNENIYELSKNIQQKEQENYILTEKYKQKQTFYTEKSKRDEDIIKSKDLLIKQLKDKISELELAVVEKEDKIKGFENDLTMKNQEIVYHKEMEEKIKEDERAEEKLKSTYYNELVETKQTLQETNAQLEKQNQKLKRAEIQLNSFKLQFEKYKEENVKAFEQFLIEIGKEDVNQSNYTLFAFPDLQISNMQIQAFKKRNSIFFKHKDTIKELEENKNLLEVELEKNKKYFTEQEQELQQSLNAYKEKAKNLQKDLLSEKEKLYENIRCLEEKLNDLRHENERLTNDVKNDKNYIEDLNAEIDKLSKENTTFQTQAHSYHKKITELKLSGSHSTSAKDSEYSSMMGEKKSQLERYRSTSATLERKIINLENSVSEKEESIKKQQKDITNLNQSKIKLEQDLQFAKKKNSELASNNGKLENEIKNLERKLKEKVKVEEELNSQLNNEKFKFEEIKLKLGKANESLIEHSAKIENLTKQMETNASTRLELSQEAKKAEKSYKDLLDRANQDIIKLKEKEILLNSELQLKQFLVQQNETNIQNMKNHEGQLSAELVEKKAELLAMDGKISELQSEMMFVRQNYTVTSNEKESLQKEYNKQKIKIQESNKQLLQYQITLDTLANKEKEVQKLRDDAEGNQIQFDLIVKDLRSTVSELKKELSQRNVKEEELKRKVREQEKLIEKKSYDILAAKKKYKGEADREKVEILHDLEEVERENTYLQRQFELQQEHFNRQIQSLTNESMNLSAEVASREQIIKNKDRQIKDYEQKLKKLTKSYLQSDSPPETSKLTSKQKQLQSRMHTYSNFSNETQINKLNLFRRDILEETD